MAEQLEKDTFTLPVPMTAFERLMLADDRQLYPMTFFIEIALSGDLQKESFDGAFQFALERHPLLRACAKRSWLQWRWVPSSNIGVQWCKDLPNISLKHRWLDLTQTPGLNVWVEHRVDQSRVLFQFHHAATDGIGAIQFIGDLLAAYGQSTTEADAEQPQITAIDPATLRLRGQRWEPGKQPRRVIRRWLYRLFEVLSVRPTPLGPRRSKGDCAKSPPPLFITHFVERKEVKTLTAEATRKGVSLNELLSLAMFNALKQWNSHNGRDSSKDVFRIGIPASTRTPAHDESPAANIVSYILLTRRATQIEDQAELLKFIAEESRQVLNDRETGLVLLSIEAGTLVPGTMPLLCRLPVTMATTVLANVGDVKRQLRNRFPLQRGKCVAGNVTLEHLLGAAPVRPGTHVATSIGKYGGRLIINLNCDSNTFSAADAEEFASLFLLHIRQYIPAEISAESSVD